MVERAVMDSVLRTPTVIRPLGQQGWIALHALRLRDTVLFAPVPLDRVTIPNECGGSFQSVLCPQTARAANPPTKAIVGIIFMSHGQRRARRGGGVAGLAGGSVAGDGIRTPR